MPSDGLYPSPEGPASRATPHFKNTAFVSEMLSPFDPAMMRRLFTASGRAYFVLSDGKRYLLGFSATSSSASIDAVVQVSFSLITTRSSMTRAQAGHRDLAAGVAESTDVPEHWN